MCRFDPTCSEYALQAFETRALAVAFAMTASRLLRCNPLAASPSWEGDQVQAAYSRRGPVDTILDAADGPRSRPPDPLDQAANREASTVRSLTPKEVASASIKITKEPARACSLLALQLLLTPLFVMPVFGASGGGGAVATAPADGQVLWTEHVRRHGHVVLGFFSGLLFGLGGTVLLWQYNVWLLNIVTAIVVPLVIAVLFAFVAWRGTRYTLSATAGTEPPPPRHDRDGRVGTPGNGDGRARTPAS